MICFKRGAIENREIEQLNKEKVNTRYAHGSAGHVKNSISNTILTIHGSPKINKRLGNDEIEQDLK